MLDRDNLLGVLPATLKTALFDEYDGLVTNFFEGRWRPAELQAGRFCEVVYTIISGRATGSYPSHPSKPANFLKACQELETKSTLERGLRILASRMLPTLYEIRNNRDVGHVGGDVDPSYMDSTYSIAAASWLLAELIRVFHTLPVADAAKVVESITQLKSPAVWVKEGIRRVLDSNIKLSDECLLLLASSGAGTTLSQLIDWTEAKNISHLKRVLADLHKKRFIEAVKPELGMELLPAGAERVRHLLNK